MARLVGTLRRCRSRLPQRAFWSGAGYLVESTHGGLRGYAEVPRRLVAAFEAQGFRCEGVVPATFPEAGNGLVVPWYAYAFRAV